MFDYIANLGRYIIGYGSSAVLNCCPFLFEQRICGRF